jgi:predicted AAA+ superfamily ATPase
LRKGSPEFGELFETYIFHELNTFVDTYGSANVCYWKSTSGLEVDFILNEKTAVEIKTSSTVGSQDLKGLKALEEEKNYILVCFEDTPQKSRKHSNYPMGGFSFTALEQGILT